jgi:hypothetical protein
MSYFMALSPAAGSQSPGSSVQNPTEIRKSMSMIDPSNVFMLNNDVLNNLNKYETKYSRYMRCQNDKFANNVSPKCDPYGLDGYASLEESYSDLISAIHIVGDTLLNQTTKDAVSQSTHDKNEQDINSTHKDILRLRAQLDEKLRVLYNENNTGPESVQAQLNSAIYANTLWTILATCLLYYIFVELN